MIQCLYCHREIREGDRYCGYCGISQEAYQIYIEKLTDISLRKQDKHYRDELKKIEKELRILKRERDQEISRIENARWEWIGPLGYSLIEGCITVDKRLYPFSAIQGAKLIQDNASRIRTKSKETSRTTTISSGRIRGIERSGFGSSNKEAFWGIGRAHGKASSVSTSEMIPTCYHLGVLVNLDGFSQEIELLNKQVDQNSSTYKKAKSQASQIIDILGKLSHEPVPAKVTPSDQEKSVIEIKKKIQALEAERERLRQTALAAADLKVTE